MTRKTTPTFPAEIQKLQSQFTHWRSAQTTRCRLPESLWRSAVALAEQHGLNRTASALRLNYYDLKRRMAPPSKTSTTSAAFMEWIAPAHRSECTVELESALGEKMRIDWKGSAPPDLIALSRLLWGRKS